ncbi:mannose-6-phosphate isomerase [Chytriomyces cf. hyalinus JEL632]|nr:mannose-6-phosphate isomerase [Chytriomyces cf. hyalinus JEL632]
MTFSRIAVKTQPYEWGRFGLNSKAGQLAAADPSVVIDAKTPYAELWMGTHPNAPSLLWGSSTPLKAALTQANLSPAVSARFAGDLPFLFKVLSIEKALSIQAHPDKKLAESLFARFPTVYKDSNHKPEMTVALTDFEALIGFRALVEINANLLKYPEFAAVIDETVRAHFAASVNSSEVEQKKALKALFKSLMEKDAGVVASQIRTLVTRLSSSTHAVGTTEELLVRLDSQFPGDVGIFCALLLNYVKLAPGEAIFLAANEPHAYISGDCVECMAASDNVVRSGLTPKFKDVNTLVEMLTYNNGPAESQILKGDPYQNSLTSFLYDPPIEEFSIVRTTLPASASESFKGVEGPSILIVTSGNGTIVAPQDGVVKTHDAGLGFVFFVGANVDITLTAGSEEFTAYRAYCV